VVGLAYAPATMTTFVRSTQNDQVLIGFFALVAAAVAIRASSPVTTAVAAAIATALVVFGLWLNRQPRWELRISPDEIALVTPRGARARIGHAEAGGTVTVRKRIDQGRAWFSLVAPAQPGAPGIPLDGFRLPAGALEAACRANGWTLVA